MNRRVTKSYYKYFCNYLIEDIDKMTSSLLSRKSPWIPEEDKMDIRSMANFTLLKAMQNFEKERTYNDYFNKYLYICLMTMIHNFKRKSKRRGIAESDIVLKNCRTKEENIDEKIDIQYIMSILMSDSKLSKMKKDILYDCIVNNLTPTDISLKTGIPVKKVYNIRQKVMSKLQGVATNHGYGKS